MIDKLWCRIFGHRRHAHRARVNRVNLSTENRMAERWITPPEIFEPLMAEFDFDIDAAADEETARTRPFLSDSLDMDWPGMRIWLNPPYGRKLEPFVRKAATEAAKGKLIVALIPFRCSAAWWHDCVIGKADEVHCIRKRVRFVRPDGTRGKFTGSCDSCIVIWRPDTMQGILTVATQLRAA